MNDTKCSYCGTVICENCNSCHNPKCEAGKEQCEEQEEKFDWSNYEDPPEQRLGGWEYLGDCN